MTDAPIIDYVRLRADMDAYVERKSGRKLSLAATGGKNPDFYRNMVNNGQDKRLTAEVFLRIVKELGKSPHDYIVGATPAYDLPSATVLTSTFAVLLNSLGIDPYEDERAQKLARQFPGALRSIEDLHERAVESPQPAREESPLAAGEGLQ